MFIFLILLGFLPWFIIKAFIESYCESKGMSNDAVKFVSIIYWIIVAVVCGVIEG